MMDKRTYAVGGLFLAAALHARGYGMRTAFFLLSFTTYETFVLPALLLAVSPTLLDHDGWRSGLKSQTRRMVPAVTSWGVAIGATLVVRGIASRFVGAFHHGITLNVRHICRHIEIAAKQLFQVRFFGTGTHEIATGLQLAAVVAALYLLWRHERMRWQPIGLLVLCLLSTAAYWVLSYSAMRAIYGSLLFFTATLAWLAIRASAAAGTRWAAVALAIVVGGYGLQTAATLSTKSHNAKVLNAQEARLAAAIRDCDAECVVEYGDLDRGLARDWVLPAEYWGYYLDWIRGKYGLGNAVQFVHQPALESEEG